MVQHCGDAPGVAFSLKDARQISRALNVAQQKSAELGLQYITMMNTDVAAEVATEEFDVKAVVMSTALSDQENGDSSANHSEMNHRQRARVAEDPGTR